VRRSILLTAAALGSFGISTLPIQAQTSRPVGIQQSRAPSSLIPVRSRVDTSTSSARRYVIGGAIIGGVAAGVGLALYFRQNNSEFLGSPFAFVPLFLGSAAVGAGVGYVVYRARN
jgi:hypothetical protein